MVGSQHSPSTHLRDTSAAGDLPTHDQSKQDTAAGALHNREHEPSSVNRGAAAHDDGKIKEEFENKDGNPDPPETEVDTTNVEQNKSPPSTTKNEAKPEENKINNVETSQVESQSAGAQETESQIAGSKETESQSTGSHDVDTEAEIPEVQMNKGKENPKSPTPSITNSNTSDLAADHSNIARRPQYMTISAFDGRRTGNLLFNVATLLGVAWQNDFTPVLYPEFDLVKTFDLNIAVVTNITDFMNGSKPLRQIGAAKYDPGTEHLRSVGYNEANVTLHGFFQSWKFFRSYQDRIREVMRFPNDTLSKAVSFFESFLPNVTFKDGLIPKVSSPGVTLIGIHVRRDDIVESHFSTFGYTFPEITFFKKAMAYFSEKTHSAHFVVCSDDITWCKSNLTGLHPNITFSENNFLTVDLAMLSMCEHVIMTTGTFSWWAAWMANGTTIYYENWPNPGTVLYNQIIKEDFFMPHWIPME